LAGVFVVVGAEPAWAAVPDAPVQPTVAAGNANVVVTFVAPFDGGSAITGFSASCVSSDGGAPGTVVDVASPITVTGLSNGKTYTCTVFASNVDGDGPASPASVAGVPNTVPSRPGQPTVAAGNGLISVSFPAPFNGGRVITSYRARCGSNNGGGSHTRTGTRSPIVVTGLANGYTYACTVLATNVDGSSSASIASRAVVPFARGFRLFSGDGGVFVFGASGFYGSAAGVARSLVIAMTTTRDNRGYWLAAQDGNVYAYGDAKSYGSMAAVKLNRPLVGMTATPSGHGYWLVASDGGIFSFGDAPFYGSTGNIRLNQPIVGMTPTPTGRGYWFVASDGGLFSYGDARFYGSAAGRSPARVVGMATSGSGRGYWIAAADGRVFAFGDAVAGRSAPLGGLRLPIMGIASTPTGRGYWLAAGDGGLFNFGDAPLFRWPGPLVLRRIIRGISR